MKKAQGQKEIQKMKGKGEELKILKNCDRILTSLPDLSFKEKSIIHLTNN
ncbi:MAG: hypothetical protein PHE86_06025 [Candidatus Marinimicrobia bacterium]|nr:hypothetical protein [Candidatus Neomarinimicrobiota bacterium]